MLYSPTCVSFSTVDIKLTLQAFLGQLSYKTMIKHVDPYHSVARNQVAVPLRYLMSAKEY